LDTRQQPLRFGQSHTQTGDFGEISGPVDLHNVRARPFAFNPSLHQPQHPGHASTPNQRTDTKIPNHPRTCADTASELPLSRNTVRRWIRGYWARPVDRCNNAPSD
jgi:hypothetical protein